MRGSSGPSVESNAAFINPPVRVQAMTDVVGRRRTYLIRLTVSIGSANRYLSTKEIIPATLTDTYPRHSYLRQALHMAERGRRAGLKHLSSALGVSRAR
ncbi:hypothetical protein O181_038637 [Austropuccinia psidii MF-1]|uniref:Uncharacterized protein n=1 Tax=Austropuccinia psidii MF-1 TaxID=1389203 RepID=A0A9Q3DBB2_9BASI|nr:hypothetical protein [Austropuccinia psidii MF-1]